MKRLNHWRSICDKTRTEHRRTIQGAATGGNLHQQVLSKIGIAGHVQFEWTSLHKLPVHHNATLQSFPGGAILTSNSFRFFLPLIMVQTKSDAYITSGYATIDWFCVLRNATAGTLMRPFSTQLKSALHDPTGGRLKGPVSSS